MLQIGSSDDVSAVKAVTLLERDVSAFDLNCGCNMAFSTKGDMGIKRMFDLEKTSAILKAMARNVNVPVTVKTRIYGEDQGGLTKDLEFLRMAELAGCKAIALHARFPDNARSAPTHHDRLKAIVEAASIPVIANGGLMTEDDITQCREASGCTSFMLARGAFSNVTLFNPGGSPPTPADDLRYLERLFHNSADCGLCIMNTRFNMNFGLRGRKSVVPKDVREAMQRAKTHTEMGKILGFTPRTESEELEEKRGVP